MNPTCIFARGVYSLRVYDGYSDDSRRFVRCELIEGSIVE